MNRSSIMYTASIQLELIDSVAGVGEQGLHHDGAGPATDEALLPAMMLEVGERLLARR